VVEVHAAPSHQRKPPVPAGSRYHPAAIDIPDPPFADIPVAGPTRVAEAMRNRYPPMRCAARMAG
jgi:hypothetical protein